MSERVSAPVTVFTEVRFVSDSFGRVFTDNWSLAGRGWTDGLPPEAPLRLAGRSHPGDVSALWPVEGDVAPLPYYVGLIGTVRQAPRMARHVWRLTRTSSAVVVKQPGMIGMLATAAASRQRRTVVMMVVGDIAGVLHSGIAGRLGRLIARPAAALTRATVRRGDVVRYVTRELLQSGYPPGADRVSVSFSDVEVHDDLPRRASEPAQPRLVAVGSQENAYKGHAVLLEAMALLAPEHPDLSLGLVGSGRHQPTLKAHCTSLGLDGRVDFMGQLSRNEVAAELDRAIVFVLPSLTEGLPRALVEAMARGLPCVGSNIGGIPELLDAHWCVRPGEAEALAARVAELLADPALRAQVGERNFEASRAFSGSAHAEAAEHWQSVVREAIAR